MTMKNHTAKLNDKARRKVLEQIDFENEMGDRQLSAALQVLSGSAVIGIMRVDANHFGDANEMVTN
ncbi:MAG: hypothetical protein U5K75_02185 [Ahrensia sp.]|nr:hypothetical protein [Ahrensia sp.]